MIAELAGAAISCILLAALLMSGRSALHPRLADGRHYRPVEYWTQVAVAAVASTVFIVLALIKA